MHGETLTCNIGPGLRKWNVVPQRMVSSAATMRMRRLDMSLPMCAVSLLILPCLRLISFSPVLLVLPRYW